jgi:hypothetical protein
MDNSFTTTFCMKEETKKNGKEKDKVMNGIGA